MHNRTNWYTAGIFSSNVS